MTVRTPRQALFPEAWDVVRTEPADGAWNMACDLVLMDHARDTGRGVLRVYRWSRPTVSFGRHERAVGLYTVAGLASQGLDAVRRPTGGRALLHHREITYSISLPLADSVRWGTAYDAVNALLAQALIAMGAPVRVQPVVHEAPSGNLTDGTPCFAGVSPGEIEIGGRKLVASAVWRDRGAFLQHGSILLADDQHRIRTLNEPVLGVAAPAALLPDYVGVATADAFADAVTAALDDDAGVSRKISAFTVQNSAQDIETMRERLIQPGWLWRR